MHAAPLVVELHVASCPAELAGDSEAPASLVDGTGGTSNSSRRPSLWTPTHCP